MSRALYSAHDKVKDSVSLALMGQVLLWASQSFVRVVPREAKRS